LKNLKFCRTLPKCYRDRLNPAPNHLAFAPNPLYRYSLIKLGGDVEIMAAFLYLGLLGAMVVLAIGLFKAFRGANLI
jgi:hypothetical protein